MSDELFTNLRPVDSVCRVASGGERRRVGVHSLRSDRNAARTNRICLRRRGCRAGARIPRPNLRRPPSHKTLKTNDATDLRAYQTELRKRGYQAVPLAPTLKSVTAEALGVALTNAGIRYPFWETLREDGMAAVGPDRRLEWGTVIGLPLGNAAVVPPGFVGARDWHDRLEHQRAIGGREELAAARHHRGVV